MWPLESSSHQGALLSFDSSCVSFFHYSNLANAIMKFILWMLTGSPSMFSEFMHSTGDTLNQVQISLGTGVLSYFLCACIANVSSLGSDT